MGKEADVTDTLAEPYVGPRTFQKGEAKIFHGRKKEARDLTALVSSQRTVLFYAQSGAGKSSLINARLVPELETKGFEVLPIGRVGGQSNPAVPVENIFVYNLLLTLDKGKENRSEEENRQLHSRCARMQLADFLNHLVCEDGIFSFNDRYQYPADYRPKPRVLVIDQFEELLTSHFTQPDTREQRAQFFEQLDAVMARDPWLWIVLSLRSDYVAGLDPYAHLLQGGLRDRYYMERMDESGALSAIMEPVKLFGWEYELAAAEDLCRNLLLVHGTHLSGVEGERVRGDFVEPVQLQVVCYQLWDNLDKNRGARVITVDDLDKQARRAGGESVAEFVDSALSQFYNRAVHDVAETTPGRTEGDVRRWFETELITPGNSRNLVFDDGVKVGSLDKDLVEKLDRTYRVVRPEVRGLSNWYELTHDRFIQPIQEANKAWESTKPPLYHAAREWFHRGQKDYFLFTGERLSHTLMAIEEGELDVSDPIVRQFLEACRRAETRRASENRVRASFDRIVSLAAIFGGAALFGWVSTGLLSILFLVGLAASADAAMVVSAAVGSAILILVFSIFSTVVGAGLGWFLKRNAYDWLQSYSARKTQLQIFRDKLLHVFRKKVSDTEFGPVPDWQ
jgi:hypothetical protein